MQPSVQRKTPLIHEKHLKASSPTADISLARLASFAAVMPVSTARRALHTC